VERDDFESVALVEAAGGVSDERRVVDLKQFWATSEGY